MTSAVLDTNTLVSGTIVPVGISGHILEAAAGGEFTPITSAAIVAEVVQVISNGSLFGPTVYSDVGCKAM